MATDFPSAILDHGSGADRPQLPGAAAAAPQALANLAHDPALVNLLLAHLSPAQDDERDTRETPVTEVANLGFEPGSVFAELSSARRPPPGQIRDIVPTSVTEVTTLTAALADANDRAALLRLRDAHECQLGPGVVALLVALLGRRTFSIVARRGAGLMLTETRHRRSLPPRGSQEQPRWRGALPP